MASSYDSPVSFIEQGIKEGTGFIALGALVGLVVLARSWQSERMVSLPYLFLLLVAAVSAGFVFALFSASLEPNSPAIWFGGLLAVAIVNWFIPFSVGWFLVLPMYGLIRVFFRARRG